MTAIRLLHLETGRHYIVAGDIVYEDSDGDGFMTSCERSSSAEPLRAAIELARYYDVPWSVGAEVNGWRLAGTLTETEVRDLSSEKVPVCRTALQRHLDFFDVDTRDGIITLPENWRGWRRLGYGWIRSLVGTIGSAVVFGRLFSGFSIDIAGIEPKRKRARSGLYDDSGNVNQQLLERCLEGFDRETLELYGSPDRDKPIPQPRAMEIITTVAAASGREIGRVSARQFSSLFDLCRRLNHGQKTITANQLGWLFDGSLLYRAAAVPGANGRLPGTSRRRMPVLALLFMVVLAIACAPRPGDGSAWRQWVQGALTVIGAAAIAKGLPHRTGLDRAVILCVGILVAATIVGRLSLPERLAVWPVIALSGVIAIVQQRRPLVQYLMFCRYPLLLALSMIALPFVAAGPAHTLFRSMLALRAWSIAFVVLLTVLAAEVFVNTASLIAHQASRRFTSTVAWRAPAQWIDHAAAWLTAAIAAPLSIALVVYAEARTWVAAVAVLGGASVALVLKMALRAVRSHDAFKRRTDTIRRSVGRHLRRATDTVRSGYLADDGTLIAGHAESAAFLVVTLAMYFAGYVLLMPGSVIKPPAIAYVVFMLIVLGWILPGVSFFADKFRVSTMLALLAVPLLLYFINDIDHYFGVDVRRAESSGGSADDVGNAFNARLARWAQRYPGQQPLVVAIAAGGGGGSSAYWTTRVLEGLRKDNGPRFDDAIYVMSAVSGGSIGSLYVIDAQDIGERRRAGAAVPCARADVTAQASTLEPIAWGLAYPDLWRFFGLRPLGILHDRGWAFERALDHQLCHPGTHLSDWRSDMVAGHRPAVLFNATASESGKRMVLSPLHFTDDQALTVERVYGENADFLAVTAARLSATFPWVTPLAKALNGTTAEQRVHLADGGYYDNAGIVTTIEWARQISEMAHKAGVRKMLFVTLGVNEQPPSIPRRAGWTLDTVGPIVTMLNVRGASQQARNEVDKRLLTTLLRTTAGIDAQVVDFALNADTSVSWRLSKSDVHSIDAYWNDDLCVRAARNAVSTFMATTPATH